MTLQKHDSAFELDFLLQEEIVCSAYATAQYLKQQQFSKKVYILGASGIASELDKVGIAHTGVGVRECNLMLTEPQL